MMTSVFVAYGEGKDAVKSPNIIVILTDDMGYKDVGFNGCEDIPTPNIDRIANDGVKFSSGYVSYAVSGPSRAGLMTGRYQDRFGFSRNPIFSPDDPEMGLPLSEQTLADIAKVPVIKQWVSVNGIWEHILFFIQMHVDSMNFSAFWEEVIAISLMSGRLILIMKQKVKGKVTEQNFNIMGKCWENRSI